MPTYQYACTVCHHEFEQVQSFHDDPITHCPECDGRVRKVFNAVGVVFKGSGFYRTDSRDTKSSSSSAPSSSDSSGSSSSSGDKSSGGSSGSDSSTTTKSASASGAASSSGASTS